MIKSLDELRKIRAEALERVALRDSGGSKGDQIEVLVGMSTCGIASGARETLNAFIEEAASGGDYHVKVVPVGCIGYCHAEPIVQINRSGEEPVFYGKVKEDKVHEIFESHIKGGRPVERLILQVDFERA